MQKIIQITSRDNPAVKHYLRLREKKKARQEEQLFVAEGLRIVRDALQYPRLVQQIFAADQVFEKYADVLAQHTGRLFRISDAVGRLMSDTEHTQGIFAVCQMPAHRPELSPDGRYLVLWQLQDPGNVGMILRTCDALGIDGIFLGQCCDLYSPKVIRATMGSIFRIPVQEVSDPAELTADLKKTEIRSFAAVLHETAVPVTETSLGNGCAVWIGNEGSGLPDSVIPLCEKKIIIPMQGRAESLNAAMAAGILAWELTKHGGVS